MRSVGGRSANVVGLLVAALVAGCNGDGVREALGRLVTDPSAVDFGPTTLGLEVRRAFWAKQRGVLPVDVVGARVEPDEGVFRLDEWARHVDRDGAVPFAATYRPVVEGRHRAVLVLALADGGELRVPLRGRGVDARAKVEGPVDFGRPVVGTVRRRRWVLRNDASTPVPVRFEFHGRDEAEFGAPPGHAWLAPFDAVELPLRYAPVGRAGPRHVELSLTACPTCAPTAVPVRADAVDRPLVAEPDPIDFGAVPVDSERRRRWSLVNVTDEVIALDSLALARGSDPGFSLDAPPMPALLAPLERLQGDVSFTPLHLGLSGGAIRFQSDAETMPTGTIGLTATAGGAQLVVTPEQLRFRITPALGRSELTVTIANGGADPASAPLTLGGLSIEGEGFVLARAPGPGLPLRAGEKVTAVVAFVPAHPGPHLGVLHVPGDDPLAPRVDVELTGDAIDASDCVLDVQPPAITFGDVRPGKSALLGARITNVGRDACTLWNAAVTGDPAFSLARPRPWLRLGPGMGVFMPVNYAPTAEGRFSGLLSVSTSRVSAPQLDVPLKAASARSCLRPVLPPPAFGRRRLDCGPIERPAAYRNACPDPVEVASLELGPGADPLAFEFVRPPPLPVTLGPGDLLETGIRFTPRLVGYTTSPLFARLSDALDPVLLPLSAEALAAGDHDERWIQPTPGKLDLLWVIDNTASMDDERAALARSVAGFLAHADQLGVDYRIGVTTTGIEPPPVGSPTQACAGGVSGAEAGRLFPVDHGRARLVDPTMPDRASVLAVNLDVGGCHSIEQGFEAARRALATPLVDHADDPSTPEPLDGNLGLVRPDATLAIVVVSDEDDASPGEVGDAVRQLRALHASTPLSFNAIVAPAGGCPSAVSPGRRYLEAVRALDGLSGDVCASDWAATLATLADRLFTPRTRYTLAADADPTTLVVTVDGVPTATAHYDAAARTVVFDTPPAAGSVLRITYREPCSSP